MHASGLTNRPPSLPSKAGPGCGGKGVALRWTFRGAPGAPRGRPRWNRRLPAAEGGAEGGREGRRGRRLGPGRLLSTA